MKRKNYCYALVSFKTGKLIITDYKLPIYWIRRLAIIDGEWFCAKVVRINLDDLQKFIKEAERN